MHSAGRLGKSSGVDYGPFLTRGTVWLALTLYVAAEVIRSRSGVTGAKLMAARTLNSLGCVLFLGHVACAFHFYHHWSHTSAYAETARQTKEYFGLNWGGGLYFNYLFLLLWLGQAIRSWTISAYNWSHEKPGMCGWGIRGFVLLMIVNGAVIFAHGPIRWFGLFLSLVLVWSWWPTKDANAGQAPEPNATTGSELSRRDNRE